MSGLLRRVTFVLAVTALTFTTLIAGADPAFADYPLDVDQVTPEIAGCEDDALDCLPAWRWRESSATFSEDLGFRDAVAATAATPTRILFGLADLLWGITLWAIGFAVSVDVIAVPGVLDIVNSAYVWVASAVGPALMPLVLVVGVGLTMFRIARGSMSAGGGGNNRFKELVVPFACVGALAGFAYFAESDVSQMESFEDSVETPSENDWSSSSSASPTGRTQVTGSPGWILQRLNRFSDFAASQISSSFLETVGRPFWAYSEDLLHCGPYQAALYNAGAQTDIEGSNVSDQGTVYAVAALTSTMWERSYLEMWGHVQFGNSAQSRRIGCRWHESRSGISSGTQYDIISALSGGSMPEAHSNVFGSRTFRSHSVAELASAGACTYYGDGVWDVHPEFQFLWSSPDFIDEPGMFRALWNSATERFKSWVMGPAGIIREGRRVLSGDAADELREIQNAQEQLRQNSPWTDSKPSGERWNEYCDAWWTEGDIEQMDSPFIFDNQSDVDMATGLGHEEFVVGVDEDDLEEDEEAAVVHRDNVETYLMTQSRARDALSGLRGERLGLGSWGMAFMSVVVAFIFMLTFGGIAVGSIAAQFGVVALAILTPFILLFGMWPGDSGKKKVGTATKTLIGMVFARAVAILILSVLAILTSVVIYVLDTVSGRADGAQIDGLIVVTDKEEGDY